MNPSSPASGGKDNAFNERSSWSLALRQLVETLQLLDKSNAPPDIGARLDEVIQRLRNAIELGSQRDI